MFADISKLLNSLFRGYKYSKILYFYRRIFYKYCPRNIFKSYVAKFAIQDILSTITEKKIKK